MLCEVLARRESIAIDVGAARGVFTAHLLPYASEVLAFEPRPRIAGELREMARVLCLPVRVESVALSDSAGSATLRMPTSELGRSTIDAANHLEGLRLSAQEAIEVQTARLDDYGLRNVGFIKIDVEGHELAVLAGGEETVIRSGCRLLIEAEDRHRPGACEGVISWMEARGFAGYFVLNNTLYPSAKFQKHVHQNPVNIDDGSRRNGVYVNNFMFAPKDQATQFVAGCERLGLRIEK